MVFGRKKNEMNATKVEVVDPTAWLIDSGLAEFLLLHSHEVKYMAMFGYTFLNGMYILRGFVRSSP